jgi:hypothetical protein
MLRARKEKQAASQKNGRSLSKTLQVKKSAKMY